LLDSLLQEIYKMDNEKNGNKSDEAAGCDDGVTMLDVLKDEQELEEDANAVLGAADDQNCTYDEGYVGRQPLYSCTTCTQPDNPDYKAAGICLACSYQCHEGHELVELYTKRQFRCDCPTKRFPSDHKCRLKSGKNEQNVSNIYGQNFSGLYCECNRPYPDPEDTTVDEMIQCALCEDWYHGRHLGLPSGPPSDGQYGEMICKQCVTKHPILMNYKNLKIPESTDKPDETPNPGDNKCKLRLGKEAAQCDTKETSDKKNETADKDVTKDNKEGLADTENSKVEDVVKAAGVETLFLPEGWRAQQCSCPECKEYYKKNKIEFILDEKDTVHFYESQGRKRAGQFEQGMEALSQMDRIKQVEAISMYNHMKTDLMDHLAQFARDGKVVKEEDIRKFFSDMKSAKRPRLDLPPPDSCK